MIPFITERNDVARYGKQDSGFDLSVIVPVYNVEHYVEHCLASLLPQRHIRIQVVIVNDGSTDRSLSVVENFVRRNCNLLSFTVISQPNSGLSASRNRGMTYAVGRYIAFIDSDDFVVPEAYSRAVEYADAYDCELVLFRAESFDDATLAIAPFNDSITWNHILGSRDFLRVNNRSHPELFLLEPSACVRIISATFARRIGLSFPVGLQFEDIHVHFLMCTAADRIGLFNHILYYYRTNRSGKITEERGNRRFDIIRAVETVAGDSMLLDLGDSIGSHIIQQLTRFSFWCGRHTLSKDRIEFYAQLSAAFRRLPVNWVNAYYRRSDLDFRYRYICYLLCNEKVVLLNLLAALQPRKIDIARFLIKQLDFAQLKQQIMRLCRRAQNQHVIWAQGPATYEITAHHSMQEIMDKLDRLLRQAGMSDSSIYDQRKRIEINFFEHRHAYLQSGEVCLIWSSDNEMLALYLASLYPFAHIVLAGCQSWLVQTIEQIRDDLHLTNLTITPTLPDAFSMIGDQDIGWLIFDSKVLKFQHLKKILETHNVRQLSGEYDGESTPEAALYKLCRQYVQRCFLRRPTSDSKIVGNSTVLRASNNPDISIIVPVYNGEKYLASCLSSLAAPTSVAVEILVVNDGSTDSTAEIAQEFANKFCNIRLINKPNGGCASARSEGLRQATGEYVAFIDSDDWIDPGMFDDMFSSALTYNSDIVTSGFRKVYQTDQKIINMNENIRCSDGICNGLVMTKDDLFWLQPAIWRSIFRRHFLLSNRIDFPHQIKRFDDLYFHFVTFSLAKVVSCVPRTYYNYRLGRVGQDVSADDERLFVHYEIFDLLKDHIYDVGDSEMEYRLKLVELATHRWGLGKIITRLKMRYFCEAARNFSRLEYVDKSGVLVHAMKFFGWKNAFFAGLLMITGSVMPDYKRYKDS